MAPGDMVPEHARQLKPREKPLPQPRPSECDSEVDGTFVFEAHEAWKEFHNSLRQFYEAGELCDVTLKVGSRLIPCHKLVLACVIPYFRAMFLSEMSEAKQELIEIRDFDGDAIQDLVTFAYSSRLTLTVDNVQPLLYAACILQVELVARACCEYMKAHFHPSNCLAVRTFAESHNRVDLMDMADRYACEHFREVVECEDFPCVSPQHLCTLLSSSDLNILSETQVYSAAVKWLKANPQHHAAWLDRIMCQVRLPLLPVDFLGGSPRMESYGWGPTGGYAGMQSEALGYPQQLHRYDLSALQYPPAMATAQTYMNGANSYSPMSYSSSPQQPSPVMSMVKPEPVSHSPTGAPNHHRGALQGDLRDMISMYIPGGDTTDPTVQRGYSSVQQHYLSGTVPLTHI